eukprot:5296889-Amphidinium_carterae.1
MQLSFGLPARGEIMSLVSLSWTCGLAQSHHDIESRRLESTRSTHGCESTPIFPRRVACVDWRRQMFDALNRGVTSAYRKSGRALHWLALLLVLGLAP